MASTMQLEFTQAMTDFKTMFPDMDDDVIEAVLRANQGAVDATIDQLLAMSTDNQNERLRQEIEKGEDTPGKNQTAKMPGTPKNKALAEAKPTKELGVPLRIRRNWAPPMLRPLPPNFLRLPPGVESEHTADLEDERIAMFLQNEEFMAELRWNHEFMNALDSEQGRHDSKIKGHDDDAAFKERLKNMGKLSRKKFAQLSKMFTWQGGKKQSGSARHGPAPDSLLLQEEHSDDEDKPSPSQRK